MNTFFRILPLLMIFSLFVPTLAGGSEPAEQVCIGPVSAQLREFKFQIHPVKGECPPGERKVEVKRDKDGTLLFLPSDMTASPTTLPSPSPQKP